MTLTCGRALVLLRGLETNQFPAASPQAKEIDELLKANLALEADPEVYQALCRVLSLEAPFPRLQVDPFARTELAGLLADLEHKLKDEWHRLGTGKEKLKEEESQRTGLRYALGQVSDPAKVTAFRKMMQERALIPQGALYVNVPQLGWELYAITHRGLRARQEIEIRLARFDQVPLAVFLKSFDKVDAKMQAFAGQLGALSAQIAPVKKHRGALLTGLVKSGLDANTAAHVYKAARQDGSAPDVAVTCARNRAMGHPIEVRETLQRVHRALVQAGLQDTPNLEGAAKVLLGAEPREAAVARFAALVAGVRELFRAAGDGYKLAARLMSGPGEVPAVLHRVRVALYYLGQHMNRAAANIDMAKVSVALASMVRTDDMLAPLVDRFFTIEALLIRADLANSGNAADCALECVVCPGTPDEVLSVVSGLVRRLNEQHIEGTNPAEKLSMAVAFAKRFAY